MMTRYLNCHRLLSKPILILSLCIAVSLIWASYAAAQVSGITFFKVGKGYTDSIPRQIIRTQDDRLFIFAPNAQYTNAVNAFWTNAAGLPSATSSFDGTTSFTESAAPLSVNAAYDGGTIIHILVNTQAGLVKDYPFDTTLRTFRSPTTLASGAPTVTGEYIGSVGISGMVDKNGLLQVAYWSNGNHITHQAYTYNASTNALTASGGATQVDTAGSANHPILAVSPLDNSVTVAWVSESGSPKILARTRSSAGSWGAVESVSTAVPWTSRNSGVNIDQGPTLLITPNGAKHLLYIENWDSTNDYGHVHYVTNSGSGWSDVALNFYSHAPNLATNSAGNLYLIGHGGVHTGQNDDLYIMEKNSSGTWGSPQLFAAAPNGTSFDASPSVKWSVVGFNRPDTIETVFFGADGGNYSNTTLYYGRFATSGGGSPTSTPVTPSATPVTPTATPVTPTSTPITPTATPVTPTATPITPTAIPTTPNPGGSQVITLQINAGGNDVNELNAVLDTSNTTFWIGNGGSTTTSYAGFRFTNVTIPPGAVVTSAHLEFYSTQSQWISINLQIAAEAADNSAAFSSSSKPSQRPLTAIINHASNVNWAANNWYSFNEMVSAVQPVISRAGWRSGNSLTIILKGTGSGTYARKFIRSFEGGAGFAARLVITYTS
ncbi:MAG: hypothetical protein ABI690_19205 [Chloroflexota bacterium]